MSVKCKDCSSRMYCIETRNTKFGTTRRYACQCGGRTTTCEIEVEGTATGHGILEVFRAKLQAVVEKQNDVVQMVKDIRL